MCNLKSGTTLVYLKSLNKTNIKTIFPPLKSDPDLVLGRFVNAPFTFIAPPRSSRVQFPILAIWYIHTCYIKSEIKIKARILFCLGILVACFF